MGVRSRAVNVENVRSVLGLYYFEDLVDRRENGRSGGDGNLENIRSCVDGGRRRSFLLAERTE